MEENLEQIIEDEVKRLAKDQGIGLEFEVVVTPNESIAFYQGNLVDVRLEAGNPPKLIFPMIFVSRCFLLSKPNLSLFEDRVVRALKKLPRLTVSLSNLIPHNLSLILVKDLDRWKRTRKEEKYIRNIPFDADIVVTFSATVTDKITGISFTAFSNSVEEALKTAKDRVYKVLEGNEELTEFRRIAGLLNDLPNIEGEPKANVILVQTQIVKDEKDHISEQLNERIEYE